MSTCARCRFSGNSNELGNLECHRFPPVSRANVWPLMLPNDWCGEWDQSAAVPAGGEQPAPMAVPNFSTELSPETKAALADVDAALRAGAQMLSSSPIVGSATPAPNVVSGAVREALDLAAEIKRDLDDDFPNHADWSITLPAGHWRTILASLSQEPSPSARGES